MKASPRAARTALAGGWLLHAWSSSAVAAAASVKGQPRRRCRPRCSFWAKGAAATAASSSCSSLDLRGEPANPGDACWDALLWAIGLAPVTLLGGPEASHSSRATLAARNVQRQRRDSRPIGLALAARRCGQRWRALVPGRGEAAAVPVRLCLNRRRRRVVPVPAARTGVRIARASENRSLDSLSATRRPRSHRSDAESAVACGCASSRTCGAAIIRLVRAAVGELCARVGFPETDGVRPGVSRVPSRCRRRMIPGDV
jgi:hypothetical protein